MHAAIETLDAETHASSPFLPTDRKWAIRLRGDTVTIVLGMKDYGRGWFSAYFPNLVATRLGIPYRQIRIYYSDSFPAVLQTPALSPTLLHRNDIGEAAGAVADILEGLCDQVIERARTAFSAMARVDRIYVNCESSLGRFLVPGRDRGLDILEIAKISRLAS